jgi:hypothetical protein
MGARDVARIVDDHRRFPARVRVETPGSGRSAAVGSGLAAAAGPGPIGIGPPADPATIGTRAGWAERLRERGYALRGHRLVRCRAEEGG